VKIVKQIVASREIDLQELVQLQLIDKINGIMCNVIDKHQEWCTDLLLEIMNEILHQSAELKKLDSDSTLPQQVYDSLLTNFKSFIKLLIASDVVLTYFILTCVYRALWRKRVRTYWHLFTSR